MYYKEIIMKKLLATLVSLLLVATMLLGVVACTPGGPDETDPEGNTIVKIMFHVDKSSTEGQAYQKRISAFNAAYKDKQIKAQAIFKARSAGASGYETELQNNQLEGTLADIITFDAPNTAAYASSGLLYDISSLISAEDQAKFYSLNKYNGKLYGLPIQESSAGFFYNKKIFRDAGIDVGGFTAENPWNLQQFRDVCARLKQFGVTAVDMRLDATKDETAPYLLYPFIYATGGSFVSEDGLTATGYYNSAETAQGFQFIKDLITEGYTSYSIGSTDFFTGKVGMYLSSGWTIPDLDNKYREYFASRDDWGLLPYPKGTVAASATGSWSYAITNNHHTFYRLCQSLYMRWCCTTAATNQRSACFNQLLTSTSKFFWSHAVYRFHTFQFWKPCIWLCDKWNGCIFCHLFYDRHHAFWTCRTVDTHGIYTE